MLALDLLLAGTAASLALWVVAARGSFEACIGYVSLGLLLALAWVRLGSIDVALTEAAIGAGIGGVLLLNAGVALDGRATADPADIAMPWQKIAIGILCALFSAVLLIALLRLPTPAPTLAPIAVEHLPETGLGNPVTAVLMAWRGIDTLLEAIVVLLAVLGIWALAPEQGWDGPPGVVQTADPDGPLTLMAKILPPIGLVVGIHVVWAGADGPGGKFQGGALLAAMLVLAWMAGLVRPPPVTDRRLILGLVAGPLVFLLVGFAGLLLGGGFLALPAGFAKPLILAVEAPLTFSIAIGLAMLLLGPPRAAAR